MKDAIVLGSSILLFGWMVNGTMTLLNHEGSADNDQSAFIMESQISSSSDIDKNLNSVPTHPDVEMIELSFIEWKEPETIGIAEQAPQDVLYVAASALNLRDGPSSSHAKLDLLERSARLIPTGIRNADWIEVEVAQTNQSGWVHGDYVRQ